MKLTAQPTNVLGWYAPAWPKGNREARDIEVRIDTLLNAGELELAEAAALARVKVGAAEGEELFSLSAASAIRQRNDLIAAKIGKGAVKGLELGDEEITDGAGLVRACMTSSTPGAVELLEDLFLALRVASHLSEGLRRESLPPSAQSPPSMPSPAEPRGADGAVAVAAVPRSSAPTGTSASVAPSEGVTS